MNGNALAGSVPQQQNQVVSPVPAQPTSAALNRPKRAPNAEHTVVEIDPQIQALCRTFSIEDRIARRLNEVMLTREETFDEDMKALWEVCENAKPSGFLMVKILELERGVFTGAGKLNREIASFASKFKLDDRAALEDCPASFQCHDLTARAIEGQWEASKPRAKPWPAGRRSATRTVLESFSLAVKRAALNR